MEVATRSILAINFPARNSFTSSASDGVRNSKKLCRGVRAGMLQDVANIAIPTSSESSILAFKADPKAKNSSYFQSPPRKFPILILIHEFWGLAPEICSKAEALADELGCIVIAPDTFHGQSTRFIPKAIFLALSTPQDRVNMDLDKVLSWASTLPDADMQNVGLMGFCYGGGKAIRYATHYKKARAVAVVYGKPLLDVEALRNISGSVLGIFGDKDTQFSVNEIGDFREALEEAGVKSKISIYIGQGHAFWRDMDQVRRGDGPQRQAWTVAQVLCFARFHSFFWRERPEGKRPEGKS
ncbi:hypothetical protein GOP47_0004176 [Adiantum capillus-veneris]|uniref:Dienelactone hydrolase domain-containing protein n=1 Tax=Adiantum capillus-veneris TaxID=13818 RepID=A0A9D4ZMC6_ADICA|nr:hypothetical protein GOP47_0004176 [Adiantum capillus-veneris]